MDEIMLNVAISIAIKAHYSQKDKAGEPYILHPLRVMLLQTNTQNRIAAVLHDVIEDGGEKYRQYIIDSGFSDEIIEALDCLTHREDDDYFDYVRRCKNNAIAKSVKLADLQDNSNIWRINNPSERDFRRTRKYEKAINVLLDLE